MHDVVIAQIPRATIDELAARLIVEIASTQVERGSSHTGDPGCWRRLKHPYQVEHEYHDCQPGKDRYEVDIPHTHIMPYFAPTVNTGSLWIDWRVSPGPWESPSYKSSTMAFALFGIPLKMNGQGSWAACPD